MQAANAEAKVGDCAKEAVAQFQRNPAAFIEKLSPAEKQKLEALVNLRVQQSVRPVNKPGYMEP
jgi:hypothetical protein